MSFHERLRQVWRSKNSLVCVGIDPEVAKIPAHLHDEEEPFLAFGTGIVDATAPYVCAFKPQAAHFAAVGAEDQLAKLIAYIQRHYPEIPVILDAKRGDVGSTAALYAKEVFERYGADAVTVNPYLGYESISPYLDYTDRGVIVLCRTSNPSSDWIQAVPLNNEPLYLSVARKVREWDKNNQCMLVTGATFPEELGRVRRAIGDLPLLVPGVGAQGGDVESVLKMGLDADGYGLCISSSRSIIYAGNGSDFAAQAALAAKNLRDQINEARKPSCVTR
ncbi:MAG: orotidine-5'-phosphate decarboxylase [Gammaproteobacteria bacterium]|nr:orotidine-5'-phosphate decarboxylase [Gammaproteobacteria bacterium]